MRVAELIITRLATGTPRVGCRIFLRRLGWSAQMPARRAVGRDEEVVVRCGWSGGHGQEDSPVPGWVDGLRGRGRLRAVP
ncbi:winged helix-turn-helix domain-containing protein [Streptomyces sp. NPDC056528]|uniref:winged helix-turn-helix domain-containing protein n=1 Tax=Streptomyces sp. NPDC056528 TaxID=3345854 RepID=UPI00368CA04F